MSYKKPIIRIFEGVDRIGKSSCLDFARKYYEDKGLKVLVVHEKLSENDILTTTEDFKSLVSSIPNFIEKTILSLETYVHSFRDYAKLGVDVILIDRLYLTFLAYANINRIGSIEDVFANQDNALRYFNIFEENLNKISSDVQMYLFIKDETCTYYDDCLDTRWQQKSQTLKKINDEYERLSKDFKSKIEIVTFSISEDENSFMNTLEQFSKLTQYNE